MNIKYRRIGSREWEEAILLGIGYWKASWFILRWNSFLQDFDEVVVPAYRVRFTQ